MSEENAKGNNEKIEKECDVQVSSIFDNDQVIFSADQIKIPQELPRILKDLSKEIIRARCVTRNEILSFAANYLQEKIDLENTISSP